MDRGDLDLVVTESGSLEPADTAVIRCRVESFLGLPAANANARVQLSQLRSPSLPTVGGLSSSATKAMDAVVALTKRSKISLPAGVASGPAASTDATIARTRPKIRSFDYVVAPHVPLRSKAADPAPKLGPPPRPPSILSILPEGSLVKAGEVVCELDASAFLDELQAQQIRTLRMRAWVEQARSILKVNEIALREYQEGDFPRDIGLIRQYIRTCEVAVQQARQNLVWSRATAAQGFRAQAQVKADASKLLDAEYRFRDAESMLRRLTRHTGRRIVTSLKAKIEAVRVDMLSLESSYQLASERHKRIAAMITHCTMRAPRDGIVVHANRANVLGVVDLQIREGLTVYQSQPIFRMLDPRNMQVKARINQSQVARIKTGLPALIRLDAFPDRVLRGTIAEITQIPAPASASLSDVRAYYATIHIESGSFDGLRTGLSAEVEILIETRRQVSRVPLAAIRWVGGRTYAAIMSRASTGPTCRWRPVSLGASDTKFAEVVSGLEPGDRVIADPGRLPVPRVGSPDHLAFTG